ncbi:MAG TPA: cytochrome c oxidase assembly protein [Stellaceae bacterium]
MRLLTVAALSVMLAGAVAGHAFAHTVALGGSPDLGWSRQPWVLCSLGTAIAWYVAGLLRMRRRDGLDRVVGSAEVAAFAAGMLVLVIALVSPLDAMGEDLFAAHMVQHLLLMLVAPPLLVAGRPAIVFVWAFAPKLRKRIGRVWTGSGLGRGVAWLMSPMLVWLLLSGSFAFWHLPAPYQWALRHELVHAVEHLSFFVTALMFWTIIIEPGGRRRIGYGATLVFVATTAVFSSLPGALIFLAPRPFYPVHEAGAAAWGLTLLEDQQIAGVIMWIPAGMVYLAAVQWVFLRWLRESERRVSLPMDQKALLPVLALALVAGVAGLGETARAQTQTLFAQDRAPSFGGNPERGASLIRDYGCGACHVVPGIAGADGIVGPPLTMIGRRIYLAGLLRNTPDNMMTWLRQPQQVVPGNAMPDMGVTPQDARDIAAYLYTLR